MASRGSRLILLVLTVWALAMILPALYRLGAPLAAFGVTANNDGVIIDVVAPFATAEESPAARAGLVRGDRIDLNRMRCNAPRSVACASLVAVLGGLGGLQYTLPGREIELAIVPKDGGPPRAARLGAALVELSWPAKIMLLADTIVGALFVVTALQLVWARLSPMRWGFFLYAVWFNPGQTYAYYAFLQSWPAAVLVQEFAEALAQGAAYAGLLVFALRFPDDADDARRSAAERAMPWLGAALALPILASGANLFGLPTEHVAVAGYLAGYLVNAAVVWLLLERRRRLPPQDEQRMRWAIAGAAIGLPAFLSAEICQSSGLPQALWGLTPSQMIVGLLYLLHGVLAYFVAVAVRRRRVVSVAIPLRHGTIITALTLVLGIPVVWLHETVAEHQEALHLPEWIWPLFVAPVALLLFHRLHEIAVELVDHVFNRRFHEMRRRLRAAGDAMRKTGGFAEIDHLLMEEPVRALRLTSAAVFRWRDGALRRAENAIGWEDAALRELTDDRDRLVLGSLAVGGPVRLRPGQWQGEGLPPEDQAPCLAVPVSGGAREAIAVALYGPHDTGTDIDADEREMLQELAAQAGLGYDRVETETLRREVRELREKLRAIPAPSEDLPR
jgi:hypothetical protein